MADRDQDRQLSHLSDEERDALRRWLGFPEEFPDAFWSGLVEKTSVDRLAIPVSNVVGVVQYRPITVIDDITGFTGTSYTDMGLSPVKVAKGRYLTQFGWGKVGNNSGGAVEFWMQPRVDSETLDDGEALITVRGVDFDTAYEGDGQARVAYKSTIRVVEVPEQGGTIRLVGKSETGATWDFTRVWMQVTKIGAT